MDADGQVLAPAHEAIFRVKGLLLVLSLKGRS